MLTYFIALVWLVNGLYCKVLNGVPRHQEIVGSILGNEYAFILTKLIGISEIFMAIWVISGIKTRLNAVVQISIIAAMNVLEFFLVPDLLLWGRFNSLFALIFIGIIYFNEFVLSHSLRKI
jgi:uncharacterized membrane protein YphA (DoxX/SURF4 family)